MCTTLQYVRRCPHPATHRFRDNLCKYPNGPTCRITDREVLVPVSCRKCNDKKKARYKGLQQPPQGDWTGSEEDFNDIWYVPSRCFIDVGFNNLDPFGARLDLRAGSEDTATSSLRSNSDTIHNRPTSDGGKRVPEKVVPMPEVSDCCRRERRNGYFATTRLESRDNRVVGRIWENRCSSHL